MAKEEARTRAEHLLTEFGLADRLYHYPYQLSIGQKRRIATARALFMKPMLLLADEPTNDLDPENSRVVVEALFSGVRSGKSALLYATHDKELAQRADTVLYL